MQTPRFGQRRPTPETTRLPGKALQLSDWHKVADLKKRCHGTGESCPTTVPRHSRYSSEIFNASTLQLFSSTLQLKGGTNSSWVCHPKATQTDMGSCDRNDRTIRRLPCDLPSQHQFEDIEECSGFPHGIPSAVKCRPHGGTVNCSHVCFSCNPLQTQQSKLPRNRC
jgi:hypothetical protein